MIRVAIIEDNPSYLKAMQTLIGNQPDMLLVHIANDLRNYELLLASEPDVVILDIDLPLLSGIEGAQLIKERMPEIGIFMLTVFEDEEKILKSIKAGAEGYLLKRDPPEKILEAIYAVYNGESILNGKVAGKLFGYLKQKQNDRQSQIDGYNLTRREKEIVELLIDGKSYKQITEACSISMPTLFTHIRNSYKKLGIHSRAEIAARFLK